MQELQKHPYHSSKCLQLRSAEKAGTGIFLMKEKAKLVKQHRERKVHQVGKRLGPEEEKMEEDILAGGGADKRKNLGGGLAQIVPNNPAGKIQPGSQRR